MVPTPQRTVWKICSRTYSAIITTLPPPRIAGVTRKPSDSTKTSRLAAKIPGSDSGRNTLAKVRSGPAPSEREAAPRAGSMPFIPA